MDTAQASFMLSSIPQQILILTWSRNELYKKQFHKLHTSSACFGPGNQTCPNSWHECFSRCLEKQEVHFFHFPWFEAQMFRLNAALHIRRCMKCCFYFSVPALIRTDYEQFCLIQGSVWNYWRTRMGDLFINLRFIYLKVFTMWAGFFFEPFEPRREERKTLNFRKESQRRPYTIINFSLSQNCHFLRAFFQFRAQGRVAGG